ncbi:MAG: hypothetical protein ACRD8Z_03025 [Nitrososphaeraceae archaeon]
MDSNSELAIVDWIRQLDIADGLKELLIKAGFTIDSFDRYSYQEFSDILHIDPYVAKIILEEVQTSKRSYQEKKYHTTPNYKKEVKSGSLFLVNQL